MRQLFIVVTSAGVKMINSRFLSVLTAGFQVKNLPDLPFTASDTLPGSRFRAFLLKKKKFLFAQQLLHEVL